MSYIGICEYVIGIIYDKDIWYYVGEKDSDGKRLKNDEHLSSFLVDDNGKPQVDVRFQDETVWLTQAQGNISIKLNILGEELNLVIKKLTSFLIMSTKHAKILTCQLEMSIK